MGNVFSVRLANSRFCLYFVRVQSLHSSCYKSFFYNTLQWPLQIFWWASEIRIQNTKSWPPRLRSSLKMIYENTHPDYFCLWKYPGRPKMPMIQTLPRSKLWCVYVLVQKRLWKDLYRQKCDMIQTLARSIYEKTQKDRKTLWSRLWIVQFMKKLELRNTEKNGVRNVGFCRFHRFCMYEALVFVGIVEIIPSWGVRSNSAQKCKRWRDERKLTGMSGIDKKYSIRSILHTQFGSIWTTRQSNEIDLILKFK